MNKSKLGDRKLTPLSFDPNITNTPIRSQTVKGKFIVRNPQKLQ